MGKTHGFLNVPCIYHKHEPSESVREQDSGINNESQHGIISWIMGTAMNAFWNCARIRMRKK